MKHIDRFLAGAGEMTLVYFYRRYGGDKSMYMAIVYGAENASKMMGYGESQGHDIALDTISAMEIVPLVTGESFSDCVERMEKLLELSSHDNFKEMEELHWDIVKFLDQPNPHFDLMGHLARRCEAYKVKIGQTPEPPKVNYVQRN